MGSAQPLTASLRRLALRRGFARDAGLLSMATATGAVASALQGVLIARWLGPRNFGVVSLIIAVPSVLFGFFDARSDVTTIKFMAEFREQGNRQAALAVSRLGYAIDVVIAFVTFAITLVLAGWAGEHLVRTSGTSGLLILYAAALIPNALATTSIAILTALGRFKLQAATSAAVVVVRFVLVVGLVSLHNSVSSVIVGYAISFVIEGGVSALVAHRALSSELGASWISARLGAIRGHGRRIARFLAFTDLTELMTLTYKQLDVVLLGLGTGPSQVGLYRLAKSSMSVLALPITPLISVTYQRMVEVSSHALKISALARRVATAVALPLGAAVVVGGMGLASITLLVAGAEYRAALPAILIWVIAYALWSALFWLRPFYYANSWPKEWFALNAVGVVAFFVTALPFFAGGGFVSLTLARCSPLVVIHLGGLALAARLWRRRAAQGWESKAGRRMWLEWGPDGRRKMVTAASAEHARFLTTVTALPAVAPVFPRTWVGNDPGTVATEWASGRRRVRLRQDQLAAVAGFQATLHTLVVPTIPSGFDYVGLIVDRFLAVRDGLSPVMRDRGEHLVSRVQNRTGPVALSYPDLQPDNLVWSDGTFKIIDLELLTVSHCFGIDLINTCATFDFDDDDLTTYVSAYADAGHELAILGDSWEAGEALWKLRVVANALEQGQPEVARACLMDDQPDEEGPRPVDRRIREVIERVVPDL